MSQGTYQVPAHCGNCDHYFQAQVERGVEVPALLSRPNCGCKTARRVHKDKLGLRDLGGGERDPWQPMRRPRYTCSVAP